VDGAALGARPPRGPTVRLLVALWLSLAGAGAGAQPLEEAKRHFTQGVALYNDGNYNAALAEFQAAYKLRKSPGVLYNIGLTEKALFHYNEAIDNLGQYLAAEPKLTAERKNEVKQLIAEMSALLATVTINVVPDGATVTLDGRTLGTAPLAPYGMAAGNHVIEVTSEGYRPVRRELMIAAGVPLTLTLKLDEIPKTGKVKISASSPSATVTIDDKPLGPVPVSVELALGGHTLEVAAKGYQVHRSELVVAAGQERTVNVVLDLPTPRAERAPFYSKWYFWVPVGAVVVGTALGVGLGVGLYRPAPLAGTLDPGVQPVN
jgi:hypothetical protein